MPTTEQTVEVIEVAKNVLEVQIPIVVREKITNYVHEDCEVQNEPIVMLMLNFSDVNPVSIGKKLRGE